MKIWDILPSLGPWWQHLTYALSLSPEEKQRLLHPPPQKIIPSSHPRCPTGSVSEAQWWPSMKQETDAGGWGPWKEASCCWRKQEQNWNHTQVSKFPTAKFVLIYTPPALNISLSSLAWPRTFWFTNWKINGFAHPGTVLQTTAINSSAAALSSWPLPLHLGCSVNYGWINHVSESSVPAATFCSFVSLGKEALGILLNLGKKYVACLAGRAFLLESSFLSQGWAFLTDPSPTPISLPFVLPWASSILSFFCSWWPSLPLQQMPTLQ